MDIIPNKFDNIARWGAGIHGGLVLLIM